MDAFIEKIVVKKKKLTDHLITFGIVVVSVIAAAFIVLQFGPILQSFSVLVAVGVVYLMYRLVQRTNIEFEYIVTNGSLDIDKIIAQRKRQRIFSADCKDFEMVAKVKGPNYGRHIQSIAKKIHAESSADSDDVYFIVVQYNGVRTVVYFEPNDRMLDSFKRFIASKILN